MDVVASPWVRVQKYAMAAYTAALVFLASAPCVSAQDANLPPDRFLGSHYDADRSLYFWFNYVDGQSYGQANQHIQLGATRFTLTQNGAWLLMGHGLVTDEGNAGAGAGVVRRWLLSGFATDFIFGAGVHWDLSQAPSDTIYHQIVGSLELLTDDWALRINGYMPVGDTVTTLASGTGGGPLGAVFFQGNNLYAGGNTYRLDEVALGGGEVELARSVGGVFGAALRRDFAKNAAEAFVGYYNLQGDAGPQAHGVKGGLRGYLFPRLAASVTVSEDRIFGTGVYGGLTWFFGGHGGNMPEDLRDKLTTPVQRNEQVAFHRVESGTIGPAVLLTDGGVPITVTHIDGRGVGTGTGTFEDPLGSLRDAAGTTTNIVYVYSGTTFVEQSYTLAPNQRLLGEGDNNAHLVRTDQLGLVTLPNVKGAGNPRPVLEASPDGIRLPSTGAAEVSNFVINEPNYVGILGPSTTGTININRTTVNGGARGIEFDTASGTANLTNVNLTDQRSVSLFLYGDSSLDVNVDATSQINQAAGGRAFEISSPYGQHHTGTVTFNGGLTATSGDGMLFANADGTYDFNGPVRLNGGDAGIDILGGRGRLTFADSAITNPTGPALYVTGGSSNVTFAGSSSLTQNLNNAALVDIANGHDGTITFGSSTTLTATAGLGLVFFYAQGTYDFQGTTLLNGGNASVKIMSGTAGTFNFGVNTSIINPQNSEGFYIANSAPNITYNGTITETNYSPVWIYGLSGGTIVFNGTVTGQTPSLVNSVEIQQSTGGSVTFADLHLGTASAPMQNYDGIYIHDNTGGSFTFNNADIYTSNRTGITAVNNPGVTILVSAGNINSANADAIVLDNVNFALNNTAVNQTGGYTVNVANSILAGAGNSSATFNCFDGGGNSGTISFNGGANICP